LLSHELPAKDRSGLFTTSGDPLCYGVDFGRRVCSPRVVARPDWNEVYEQGDLPWDTGVPDPHLVELVRAGRVPRGRAIEVGCGTGTNARWLAEQGFEVVGIDLSPKAIELARAKAVPGCRFEVVDFLKDPLPDGPFDFAFDRGCLHVFESAADQAAFAARVASLLGPSGLWMSLIGSTEGAPRDVGPPRRNAREILAAVEPVLELVELRATTFERTPPVQSPKAWQLLAQQRTTPAQPSSRWT
jgi:SAM-dependent methyltransferase